MDLDAHESTCLKTKCGNELCQKIIEDRNSCVVFQLEGEQKFACSKKCKKVAKFSILLQKHTEHEVLKGFETMLRKKQYKKNAENSGVASPLKQAHVNSNLKGLEKSHTINMRN